MALADRAYYKDPPRYRDGNRLGSPMTWSANTWIIVINCAVFVLGFIVFSGRGVPVEMKTNFVSGNGYVESRDYVLPNGAPASAQHLRTPNTVLGTYLLNPQTGQPYIEPVSGRFLAREFVVMEPLSAYGHFSTHQGFELLQVWRLVTFQFLHGGIVHIFFNMFGLYMFGPIVESYLGKKKYLAFYLTSGIFGGLMYLLLNLIGLIFQHYNLPPLPGILIDGKSTPLVGASAGVFGVIMACAKVRPNDRVSLLFPPVELSMRLLAYGYVAIAAINLLINNTRSGSNAGGDAAHIGGALAGYFFIRHPHLLTDFFDIFTDSRRAKKASARGPVIGKVGPDESEIDRILAKVATSGTDSLTESERAALRTRSDRLQRRAE